MFFLPAARYSAPPQQGQRRSLTHCSKYDAIRSIELVSEFFLSCIAVGAPHVTPPGNQDWLPTGTVSPMPDRKSTRLNSSHQIISYAVFCLKKKKRTPK